MIWHPERQERNVLRRQEKSRFNPATAPNHKKDQTRERRNEHRQKYEETDQRIDKL